MDKAARMVQMDKVKNGIIAAMGREKNVEGRLRAFVSGVLANSRAMANEVHEESIAAIEHIENDLDAIVHGIIHGK